MKKAINSFFILTFLLLAFTACSSQNPEAMLSSAVNALEVSDFKLAQSLSDKVSDIARNDSLALSSSQYCRLALIYMTLAEQRDFNGSSPDDNIAAATAMFKNALNIAPDSVIHFIREISHEESRHAELLLRLSDTTEIDNIIYDEYEETDSIATDNNHNHTHEN